MIINCPYCEKKFEVDENLIPHNGRLLKCGSCDQTWFFNKNSSDIAKDLVEKKKEFKETPQKKDQFIYKTVTNPPSNIGSEIVKYQPKFSFSLSKFISYVVVSIISFIGLIIILDTFKIYFFNLYPNLEFYLYSLYETLKDIELFIKDLF